MPDQNPAPLTDDELREIADTADAEMLPDESVQAMATELLAARAVTPETSDGYHTFAELYHYRMLYNAALFNEWAAANRYTVHKSIRHADGELCFGGAWFVVYAQLPTGQISNHYEMTDWDRFRVPERERAAEWDGHTPEQVAERLAAFLKLGPGGPRFSQRHLEQVTRERDEARARIAELEQQWRIARDIARGNSHAYEAAIAERDSYVETNRQLLASMRTHIEILDRQRTRITDLEERGAKQRARITQLEMWKANAETTLTEDQRYIAEANSGELVRRLGSERDAARNRITELEAQAAILADSEVERARLSLYARNARRAIRTLWESRRHWQDRVAGLEAERDGLHQAVDHRREVIREVIREMAAEIATARDRIAELEAEQPAPVAYSVIHRLPDGEVAFTNRYYLDRARADQRAADDGAAYSVVELREVSDRGE